MILLKQNTPTDVILGCFIDDTDGKTPETALTITQADVRVSKNAAAYAQKTDATSGTHREHGYYMIDLGSTDTNTLGMLDIHVHISGALPVYQTFMVVMANTWDSVCGSDTLHSDLTQIGGTTQSATDLKDFADAGYDPATNKVQGVVLCDTTTTNADMVGTNGANTVVPDAAGVAPTAVEIRTEMDSNSVDLNAILEDTGTTIPNQITGLNNISTTQVNTECDTALSDIHLDHLLAVNYDPASKPGVATALLNELVENDGGVSRYTANALEQAPSGGTNPNVLIDTTTLSVTDQTHFTLTAGSNDDDAYKDQAIVLYDASNSDFPSVRVCSAYTGASRTVTIDSAPDFSMVNGDGAKIFVTAPGTSAPTSSQNADAVWDELKVDHVIANSFGDYLDDKITSRNATTPPTVTEIRTEMDTNSTKMAPSQTLNDYKATGFNTVVPDAAGVAPTADEIADGVWDELKSGHVIADSFGDYLDDEITSRAPASEYDTAMAHLDVDVSSRNAIAPNTVIPDVAGTAPTAVEIRTEMDNNSTKMAPSQVLGDYKATSVTVSDKTGFELSDVGIDAILDETIEGVFSFREIMRLLASAMVGKSSGGGTTQIVFRDISDTKNRITATVTDVGNRTTVVLDES